MAQLRSNLDYVKRYIEDMKYQVKLCNGRFLAGYAANASSAIRDAYHNKEIDTHTASELRKQVNELIESFDKNCTCIDRLIKKK